MRRRKFITLLGAAVARPLAARAQQGERMRRIGVLLPTTADDAVYNWKRGGDSHRELIIALAARHRLPAVRVGLKERQERPQLIRSPPNFGTATSDLQGREQDLLDNLVGPREQRRRHLDAERLGGLE